MNEQIQQYYSQFLENPSDERVFQKLEEFYLHQGQWEKLQEIYDKKKSKLSEKDVALLYSRGASKLRERGLVEEALNFYDEALKSDPSSLEAIRGSRALAISLGKWDKVLEVLDKELKSLKDAKEKAKLFHEMGTIYWEYMKEPKKAETHFNKALLLDSEYLPSMEILEKIYRQEKNWEMLAGVLATKEPIVAETSEKIRICMQIAALWEEHLRDVQQAVSWYFKALYMDLGNFSIMERMEELTNNQNWDLYIRVRLLRSVQTEDQQEGAAILREVGDLWIKKLGREARGVSCYQRAWELSRDEKTLEKLIKLYKKMEAHHNLSSALVQKAQNFVSQDKGKLALLEEAASLVEGEAPKKALAIYLQARSLDPSSRQLLGKVKDLTAQLELWQNHLETLQEQIELESDDSLKEQLWLEHGRVNKIRLNNYPGALNSFRQILKINPTSFVAFKQIELILEEKEEWAILSKHYEHWIENWETKESPFETLMKLCQIFIDRLEEEEAEKALPYLRKAWELQPGHEELFDFYRVILENKGEYEELYGIYREKVHQDLEQEELLGCCLLGADIALKHLEDHQKALELLEIAYERNPQNPTALDKLSQCYLALENWKRAVHILKEKIDFVEEPSEKAELYFKIGEINYRELQDLKEGQAYYQLTLNQAPDKLEALEALREIFLQQENFSEVVKILQRKAQIIRAPLERRDLLLEAARLIREHIDPGSLSEEAYKGVYQEFQSCKDGFIGLKDAYLHQEKYSELAALYAEWAQREHLFHERFQYLCESGRLYLESLGNLGQGILLYEEALALEPRNKEILTLLENLYASNGSFQRQASVLLTLSLVLEEEEEVQSRLKLGKLLLENLSAPLEASLQFERVLALDGTKYEALDCLLEIYRTTGEEEKLLARLLQKIESLSGEDQVPFLKESSKIAYEKLSRIDLSITLLKKILSLKPRDHEGLALLREIMEVQKDHEGLAWTYDHEIEHREGNYEELIEANLSLAAIYKDKLFDIEKATITYQKVLFVRATEERATKELIRIFIRYQRWDDLLNLYEKIIHSSDNQRAAEYFVRMGEAYELFLKDYEKAKESYQKSLSRNSGCLPAFEKLSSVLLHLGEYEELTKIYLNWLEEEGDLTQARNICFDLANVYELYLQNYEMASEYYSRALSLDAQYLPAVASLNHILRVHENYEALIDFMQRETTITEGNQRKGIIFYEMGRLAWEKLVSTEEALEHLKQALEVVPDHIPTLHLLEEIYSKEQKWGKLLECYECEENITADQDRKIWILQQMSLLLKDRLKYAEMAEEKLNQALELDPENISTLFLMADLHREELQFQSLFNTLTKISQLHQDSEVKKVVFAEMARVALSDLKNIEIAERCLQQALQLDSQDLSLIGALKYILKREKKTNMLIQWMRDEIGFLKNPIDTYPLRLELSALLLEKGEIDEVISIAAPVLESKSEHTLPALQVFKEAYTFQGDWEGVMEMLERELDYRPAQKDRVRLLLEMGRIAWKKLSLFRVAQKYFQEVLKVEPGNLQALSSLEELLTNLEEWPELVSCYYHRASVLGEGSPKVESYIKAGWILKEHLSKPEEAFSYYQLALKTSEEEVKRLGEARIVAEAAAAEATAQPVEAEEPSEDVFSDEGLPPEEDPFAGFPEEGAIEESPFNGDVEDALADSFLGFGGEEESSLEDEKLMAQREKERRGLEEKKARERERKEREQIEAAKREEQERREREEALKEAKKVMTLPEIDQAISDLNGHHGQAISALIEICRTLSHHAELVEMLSWKAEEAKDSPYEYIPILAEMGQTLELHLKDKQRAVEIWERVLRSQDSHREALSALDRLYTALEKWNALIRILEKKADLAREETAKAQIYFRIGTIFHKNIADFSKSASYFERGLKVLPNEEPMLAELSDIYREDQRFDRLIEILERRINLTQDLELKMELEREIGSVLEIHLKDYDKAIGQYEKVWNYRKEEPFVREHLLELYGRTGAWEKLILLLDNEVRLVPSDEEKASLYMEIATLWEKQLNRPTPALNAYEEVFQMDQSHEEAREGLKRIYHIFEDFEKLVGVYQTELSLAETPEEKILIQHHLGETYRHGLQNDIQAICSFEEALKLDPSDWVSIASLQELYPRAGRWLDLVKLLASAAKLSEENPQKVRYLLERGRILDKHCNNTASGAESLREALGLEPENLDCLTLLRTFCQKMELWDEFLEVSGKMTSLLESQDLCEIYLSMGEVYFEHKKEPQKSLEYLGLGLALQEDYRAALKLSRKIYLELKDWEKAVVVLEREEVLSEEALERGDLRFQRAEIFLREIKNQPQAMELYGQVLEDHPLHRGALETLSNLLYSLEEKWEESFSYLEKLLGVLTEEDLSLRAETNYRLATIFKKRQDQSGAISYYQTCLKDNIDHLNALEELSEIYFGIPDYENSLSIFKDLSRVYEKDSSPEILPKKIEVWRNLGKIAFSLEKWAESREFFGKVLSSLPDDLEALKSLALLAEKEEDFEGATKHLSHAASIHTAGGGKDKEVAPIFFKLGNLYWEKLNDIKSAVSSYRDAIESDPQFYEACLKIVAAAKALKSWKGVLDYAPKALALCTADEDFLDLHLSMAKAHISQKSFPDGLKHLDEALQKKQDFGEALEQKAKVYLLMGQWDQTAAVLEQYIQVLPDLQDKIPLHLRLAQVYEDKLNNFNQAIVHLKWVLKGDANHRGAHASLARLYKKNPAQIKDAIYEHYYFIKAEPWAPDHYRNLLTLYQETKQWDGWFCVAEVLDLFGVMIPSEKQAYDRGLQKLPYLNRNIDQSTLDRYFTLPGEKTVLSYVMAQMEGELTRAFPPTYLDRFNLKKRDVVPAQHPLAKTVALFDSHFGNLEIDLYQVDDSNPWIYLENTAPASLIVSKGVWNYPERYGRFLIAEKLSLVEKKRTLLSKISEQEFQLLLDGVEEFFDRKGLSPQAQEMGKKIKASLSRRCWKALEPFLRQYQQEKGRTSPSQFYRDTMESTHRYGLVFSNSLKASLEALQNRYNSISLAEAVKNSQELQNLLFFCLTSEFLVFRKTMGLAVGV